MKRWLIFLYGVLSYAIFFATFLYAIGFVGNLWVPKSIDSARETSLVAALLINAGLLGVFAIQHSVMARPAFKRWWTRIIPKEAERSTYTLLSSVALIVLFAFWEPIGGTVWSVQSPLAQALIYVAYAFGWGLVLVSTFLINHFDLFGLRQVWLQLRRKPAVQDSGAVSLRASSALRRLVLRVLGDADHDGGAPGVRSRDDRVHPDRDSARRARLDGRAPRVCAVSQARPDARAVHEATA